MLHQVSNCEMIPFGEGSNVKKNPKSDYVSFDNNYLCILYHE